jgi:hypothetical protein
MGRKLIETAVSVAAFLAIWTVMRDGCFERAEDVDAIHAENALHARERAAAIPPDFVVPDSFPELLTALERLTGSAPVPFVGERDWEAPVPSDGFAFRARSDTLAEALADTLTRLVRPKGFHTFSYASGAGIGPSYVVAMPTPDWYSSIELVATTGNPSPSSKEIVSWFRTLEREQPFTITDIGRDHVGGRFLGALKDPGALARRFNDFCPDIVTQGTRSVRNLEIELRESQYLYCWWD